MTENNFENYVKKYSIFFGNEKFICEYCGKDEFNNPVFTDFRYLFRCIKCGNPHSVKRELNPLACYLKGVDKCYQKDVKNIDEKDVKNIDEKDVTIKDFKNIKTKAKNKVIFDECEKYFKTLIKEGKYDKLCKEKWWFKICDKNNKLEQEKIKKGDEEDKEKISYTNFFTGYD